MLEVLGEDYIRTARAKGLSQIRVVALHAFRNALIPVVTVIGLPVGVLFTGAILTETIFSWPGVGKWLIEAIARRDYPVLQGGILLLGAIVVAVNLLVDITYGQPASGHRHRRHSRPRPDERHARGCHRGAAPLCAYHPLNVDFLFSVPDDLRPTFDAWCAHRQYIPAS